METCQKIIIICTSFFCLFSIVRFIVGITGLITYQNDKQFKIYSEITIVGIVMTAIILLIFLILIFYRKFCQKKDFHYMEV